MLIRSPLLETNKELFMKIIFFGSDDFALTNLEKLGTSGHAIVACVTQPDKAQGRGLKVLASPIKEFAVKRNIPVHQPADLNEQRFKEQLRSYHCDLFVVVAYGKILPLEVLSIPYLCAMNVHGSLLPKYRGAAPIHWAIINGDTETGISIIKMNAQMDAGDIFAQTKIKIDPQETAGGLRLKMAALGADLLVKTINSLEKNAYTLAAQDNTKATFAPKLTKELGLLNWTKDAASLANLIRGLLPKPAAYTYYIGKMLKVLEAEVLDSNAGKARPGEVIGIEKNSFIVQTGRGLLKILKVHLESSREMDAASFISGQRLKVGFRFEQ